MAAAKFIIVEDDPGSIQAYRKYLINGGVQEDDIWPPTQEAKVLRDAQWIRVRHTIEDLAARGFDPRTAMVVLILDLALNTALAPEQGIEAIQQNGEFFEPYVQLVISAAADSAESKLIAEVDGILAKRELEKSSGGNPRFGHFKFWNAMRAAAVRWSARTKRETALPPRPPTVVVAEEISIRLFQARFGMRSIDEIAAYVSDHHEATEAPMVSIADGGFSGAAVLLIHFQTKGGKRAVALKLSESRERLMQESKATDEAVEASGKFDNAILGGLSAPEKLPLGDRTVFCSRQVVVDGRTLDDAALDMPTREFDTLCGRLEEFLRTVTAAGVHDRRMRPTSEAFLLSSMQFARFSRSLNELTLLDAALGEQRNRRGGQRPQQHSLSAYLTTLPQSWPELCERAFPGEIPCYEQHGDLHGRNVLVGTLQGGFKLIDAARFDVWPAFYDLARLHLNLAVRLLDPPSTALHHLTERIPLWNTRWNAALSDVKTRQNFKESIPEPMRRFENLSKAILRVAISQAQHIGGKEEAYKLLCLSRCYDLIKMISYVDLPAARRLWLLRLLKQNTGVLLKSDVK